jgi:phosphonoacetate hydrolase
MLASSAGLVCAPAFAKREPQRVVVVMCDGFGLEYLEQSPMPELARWRKAGLFRRVQDTMPSVTNTNNASICCGVWPDQHGITGNSYFNEQTGREESRSRPVAVFRIIFSPEAETRVARPSNFRR